jgi:hypothetical protein
VLAPPSIILAITCIYTHGWLISGHAHFVGWLCALVSSAFDIAAIQSHKLALLLKSTGQRVCTLPLNFGFISCLLSPDAGFGGARIFECA